MRCSDFLDNYSDFRDGTVEDPVLQQLLLAHREMCHRCTRYDDLIERGLARLRAAEPVEPSRQFRPALRRRLAASAQEPAALFPIPVRFVGSQAVAAAVATLVIEGLNRYGQETDPLTPPARSMPVVRANPSPPFVTFADLASPTSVQRPVSFVMGDAEYTFQPHFATTDTVDRD